jgi:uncharacterized protein YggE
MNLPKWLVGCLGCLLIAFVALLIVQKAHDLQVTFKNQKPANTISVSADGKITATPDLAMVNIGVLTQGTSAQDVKDKNNTKINQITDFIKQQGVAEADITTAQFYFYPQQDYTGGAPRISGYQGNQTVTVKVHGIDKSQSVLEKILDGVVNAGANQIQGVSFTFNRPEDLQQQARKLAIDNAKKKATELAQEAGLTLGKVVSIAETNNIVPGPIPYAMDATPMGLGAGAVKSVAPNVEPGSQDITESMSVTFEVK